MQLLVKNIAQQPPACARLRASSSKWGWQQSSHSPKIGPRASLLQVTRSPSHSADNNKDVQDSGTLWLRGVRSCSAFSRWYLTLSVILISLEIALDMCGILLDLTFLAVLYCLQHKLILSWQAGFVYLFFLDTRITGTHKILYIMSKVQFI